MSTLPTRIEREAGRRLTPLQIFDISAARETALSRLLMLYISTGLMFMLVPGTFLGVWNLLAISSQRSATRVSAAWVQAHGHAQVFGWIGTFILGIGFYSIPKLRGLTSFGLGAVKATWAMWTCGVGLHWLACVYFWHWQALLPLSAALEVAAFAIFFRIVAGHRPQGSGDSRLPEWVLVVIAGAVGFLLTLVLNAAISTYLALRSGYPEIPANIDQRFLILQTWGFLVPFVWGFSAKWLPVFLGLQPTRGKLLLKAVAINSAAVFAGLFGRIAAAVLLFLAAIALATYALRIFAPAEKAPKVKGVHQSFPVFVRGAYVWALIASVLAIWAASAKNAPGIWGASRHALTVGFLATMVFAIGQRVLPAFSGMRLLYSPKMMFVGLAALTAGCFLRVSAEVLAYQGFLASAWSWLPISALTEMSAVTVFAINLVATFASKAPAPQKQCAA